MAESIASAVVQQVVEQLTSVARQEIGLYRGFNDELDNLASRLRMIQLVLRDAEVKQRKSKGLQDWLRKLKDAAYDAEDILDLIATESLRRGLDSQRGTFHKFKFCLSLQNPLAFRLMMAHKVKKRMETLDAIANERQQFDLSEEGVVRYGVTSESRETSSRVNESEIYGREEEKEMIVEKVLGGGGPGEDGLSVCAIWGMGGLGKTTLAQLVYNDERVVRHFELRIWVCVSNDFSTQKLVRAIIESIDGDECRVSGLDPLQRKLQEKLRGRRFLLVLDDVWNDNPMLWDPLKEILTCGSEGSMLVVTTRIEKVASMMAKITPHKIGFLSEDDSWTLFRRRALADGDGEENLVAIGKEIVKKCGGVPLAIKALGSQMQFKCHESEWLAVRDSETWDLTDEGNDILPVLRLSYDNLTPQMRQCFAYCCIFPKDYEMEKDELIQLWMANGFIFSKGKMDMHVAGHLIFRELVWKSFLQDVQTYNSGRTTCKMHDLMHDLASSVMGNETYVAEGANKQEIPKMLRHLSIDSRWVIAKKSELKRPVDGYLRSLIVQFKFYGGKLGKGFACLLIEQQHLRALDTGRGYLGEFTSTVCKLKQLRFLAISCYEIKRLPESLTHLVNLQTLRLRDTRELLELPKGMKIMKDLYVVELDSYYSLRCTPPGLGDLTRLCGLSIFIVGQDAPHRISQLKELNLRGELSIKGLENVKDFEDAKSANMMGKKNLTSLSLYWTGGSKVHSAEHFEEVIEGLQPPRNLEKMYIKSYQGFRFPSWISTVPFANLSEIGTEYCERCEHLLPVAKLPSLKRLKLRRMDCMKHFLTEWHGGNAAFPALTHLEVIDMPNFEGWKIIDSIVCFPCLEDLKIRRCPKLTKLPSMPTLKNLEISDPENAAIVGFITFLTALRSLELNDIKELNVLPAGLLQNHKALEYLDISKLPIRTLSDLLDNLSALKTLILIFCPNLEFFPERLQHLNSLESLDISYCDSIRSFPSAILENLPSLQKLRLHGCRKLNPLSGPLQRATTVQTLYIGGFPEIKILPESLQQFCDLRDLSISDCQELYNLPNWLGGLQLLSSMRIWGCKNLMSLPDSFRSLRSLRHLSIYDCPHLVKRCKKPDGADWPKITHIAYIEIDNEVYKI